MPKKYNIKNIKKNKKISKKNKTQFKKNKTQFKKNKKKITNNNKKRLLKRKNRKKNNFKKIRNIKTKVKKKSKKKIKIECEELSGLTNQQIKMLKSFMISHLKNKKKIGRPRSSDEKAVNGILYILRTGAQWRMLPKEYGNWSTVYKKFFILCKLNVFLKFRIIILHLYYFFNPNQIKDLFLDCRHVPAPFENNAGKSPVNRGKNGIKICTIITIFGLPVCNSMKPGNLHDLDLLEDTFKKVSSIFINIKLGADSAFDCKWAIDLAASFNFELIASINNRNSKVKRIHSEENKKFLRGRNIIERHFAKQVTYRSLKICWSKLDITYLSFLDIFDSITIIKKICDDTFIDLFYKLLPSFTF
jgi:hypothetical protein